ncbi:ATP-binding protein [Streptomyces sp. NPDC058664]|uniref:ATP-binding protein n=1 Tax=unclassified Streptomyces TaxID=2593676 RepID=UPI003651E28E
MYAISLDSSKGHTGGAAACREPGLSSVHGGHGVQVPSPHRPSDNDVTHPLEHQPEAVGAARHTVHPVLHKWQLSAEACDAVLLVVSELVTNAVEHAQPPLTLHLHREPTGSKVWVGVTDGGPACQEGTWTSSCTDDEHGRGMIIVEALADAHGNRAHPGGTTHWARLSAA